MVPHRKALVAIALAAHCSSSREATVEKLCTEHAVAFPGTFDAFWLSEIQGKLSPEQYVAFTTSDYTSSDSHALLADVARVLGVASVLRFKPSGAVVVTSPEVAKWRKHREIRVGLECMAFCGISVAQMCEDFRSMYQIDFSEDNVILFTSLYCDVEYAIGESWALYAETIGAAEAAFKSRLMQQPKDYVRHKLGVAVRLEPEQVLNRLMSDSYYASLSLTAEAGPDLSKDEINRIKFERDTVFKAMDRLTKFRESSGGNGASKAADAISHILLSYESTNHVEMKDLDSGDTTLDALNA